MNNISDSSGYTSSQITINKEFSHQDSIRFEINTTDNLSNYSVYNWTFVVDSSNSHQILISVTGDYLAATNPTLGPTGRLVPGYLLMIHQELGVAMQAVVGMKSIGSKFKRILRLPHQPILGQFNPLNSLVEVWTC